jgi:hypothetical protein
MAGGDNSIGYLRQINEKMDRLLAIAERYVGGPVAVEVAAEPAVSVAEPASASAAAASVAGAGAPYVIPRKGNGRPPPAFVQPLKSLSVPIERTSAQGTARMFRRLLERGVADKTAKAKIEKDLRELQPKIDAEIAAGIPLESEFQGQYDAAVLYLTREGLKPETRERMEKIRNDLKVKLNAEKAELAGAKGGSRRRRKSGKKTRNRHN